VKEDYFSVVFEENTAAVTRMIKEMSSEKLQEISGHWNDCAIKSI
jgi:hypothetical protein